MGSSLEQVGAGTGLLGACSGGRLVLAAAAPLWSVRRSDTAFTQVQGELCSTSGFSLILTDGDMVIFDGNLKPSHFSRALNFFLKAREG